MLLAHLSVVAKLHFGHGALGVLGAAALALAVEGLVLHGAAPRGQALHQLLRRGGRGGQRRRGQEASEEQELHAVHGATGEGEGWSGCDGGLRTGPPYLYW